MLLTLLPLALLAWVALNVRGEPSRLAAGVPSLLLSLAYMRSGRSRR